MLGLEQRIRQSPRPPAKLHQPSYEHTSSSILGLLSHQLGSILITSSAPTVSPSLEERLLPCLSWNAARFGEVPSAPGVDLIWDNPPYTAPEMKA